jgi:hypothetical protein
MPVSTRKVVVPAESVVPLAAITPSLNTAVARTGTFASAWPAEVWTCTTTQIGVGAVAVAGVAWAVTANDVPVPDAFTGVAVRVGVLAALAVAVGVADPGRAAGAPVIRNEALTGTDSARVEIVASTLTRVPCSAADGCRTTDVTPWLFVAFM